MSEIDNDTLVAYAKDLEAYHGLDIVTGDDRLSRCWGGSFAFHPPQSFRRSIKIREHREALTGFRIARCHTV